MAEAVLEDGRGPGAKERRRHLEAGKGKAADSLLELPEATQPCGHLAFHPVKVMLDSQPAEL